MTNHQPRVRMAPRRRGQSAKKLARLADLEMAARPGTHVVSTGHGTCHWCGFRLATKGHPNCPEPPP